MQGEMAAQRGGEVAWMAGEGEDEVVVAKPNRDHRRVQRRTDDETRQSFGVEISRSCHVPRSGGIDFGLPTSKCQTQWETISATEAILPLNLDFTSKFPFHLLFLCCSHVLQ